MRTIIIIIVFSCQSLSLLAQSSTIENIDFTFADSVTALYPGHSVANLKVLSDKLTRPFSTEVEKFRAIYTWVCTNIENDYDLYIKNKRKRKKLNNQPEELAGWNAKLAHQTFGKLLRHQVTVCTGYAYLLKELAFHAGLRCEIIDGYGRTALSNIGGTGVPNHSWNAVQIDGNWYLCDATWSSGAFDVSQRIFLKKYSQAYFLANPELFIKNHYPVASKWTLLEDTPTLSEYLNGPIVYIGAFEHQTIPTYPHQFKVAIKKNDQFSLRFKTPDDQVKRQYKLEIVKGSSSTSTHPEVLKGKDGVDEISYLFKSNGRYALHLLVNDEYVFTYEVTVSK